MTKARQNKAQPKRRRQHRQKLKELSDEKIRAINNKDFALALKLREQEKTLCANNGGYTATLTADDIADVVTQYTDIPVRYNGNDTTKWLACLEKRCPKML